MPSSRRPSATTRGAGRKAWQSGWTQAKQGRFRRFTREWIAERGDSLDISWLKDESAGNGAALPEPAVLAEEAMGELVAAMEELRGILAELGEEEAEVDE